MPGSPPARLRGSPDRLLLFVENRATGREMARARRGAGCGGFTAKELFVSEALLVPPASPVLDYGHRARARNLRLDDDDAIRHLHPRSPSSSWASFPVAQRPISLITTQPASPGWRLHSGFYRYIYMWGYPPGPTIPFQIAYFPLYPIAAHILGFSPRRWCAILLSNLCSLVGFGFLYPRGGSFVDQRTHRIHHLPVDGDLPRFSLLLRRP